MQPPTTLTELAQAVLTTSDPSKKASLTTTYAKKALPAGPPLPPPNHPSRPPLPKILPISQISRKTSSAPSNIFYIHSLAHVELNAIDLAFDTFLRFPNSDPEWGNDWLSIAADEARHYTMLTDRLRVLGYQYGDLPSHNQIWDSATISSDSVVKRLALGQLVAEARGLDAGPRLAARLTGMADHESATIVAIIAREEVRHVSIGVKWFARFCEREGKIPLEEFKRIALGFASPGAFLPPFNTERRLMAGLGVEWYLPIAEELKRRRERGGE